MAGWCQQKGAGVRSCLVHGVQGGVWESWCVRALWGGVCAVSLHRLSWCFVFLSVSVPSLGLSAVW